MHAFKYKQWYKWKNDVAIPYNLGISTSGIIAPRNSEYIFMRTGNWGDQNYFTDHWDKESGYYLFVGSGSPGAMKTNGVNGIVIDQPINGKIILLFYSPSAGHEYQYWGEFLCCEHEFISINPNLPIEKQVLILKLAPITVPIAVSDPAIISAQTEAARNLAWSRPPTGNKNPEFIIINNQTLFKRIAILRGFALNRANGVCEYCNTFAPFLDKKSMPYLEAHHILPLAEHGEDEWYNMVALCPNCHRNAHVGIDSQHIRETLQHRILQIRKTNFP